MAKVLLTKAAVNRRRPDARRGSSIAEKSRSVWTAGLWHRFAPNLWRFTIH